MKNEPLEALAAKIHAAGRVALLCHVSPDCDTLGSSLALAEAIRMAGKQAVVFSADKLTDKQMILCGAQEVVQYNPHDPGYDLGVLVDCSHPGRVGDSAQVLDKCEEVTYLDHHVPEESGEVMSGWRDVKASSAGEMMCALIHHMGVGFTSSIAANLYMAISTDTGHFSYSNTTAQTHRAAAELLEAGADSARLTEWLYRRTTVGYTRLLAQVLSTLELLHHSKVALLSCAYSWLEACGAQEGETEGMIDYARDIQGVEIAAILKEGPDGVVRVSLRSKRRVDVQKIAATYGGGGHVRAAGCTLKMPLDQAKEEMKRALCQALEM
ncbi:DHH family phosphoesterase [Luoshenia tenuis]|jgi:phosphoesterase RecJ-like protein|uniref:DHH family phosphoesterase n=1 Tax=Luoshenia tenuis TaxID=2763654 RepID=UPI003D8ED6EE